MKNIPNYNQKSVLEELASFIESKKYLHPNSLSPFIHSKLLSKQDKEYITHLLKKLYPLSKIEFTEFPSFLGKDGQSKTCKTKALGESKDSDFFTIKNFYFLSCEIHKVVSTDFIETKIVLLRGNYQR